MKKISFITILLLVGCTQLFPSVQESPVPLNENFEISERCPKVCWMGIIPETTSIDEAVFLLEASDQVDRGSIQKTKDGIEVKWFNRAGSENYVWVLLSSASEDDIVQKIQFVQLHPYTVNDFIDFLGEPNEISISLNDQDGIRSVTYALYYSSLNAFFYVNNNAITTGPDPKHTVGDLYLNMDFQHNDIPQWIIDDYNNRHIWLGFGQLAEYLPDYPSKSP